MFDWFADVVDDGFDLVSKGASVVSSVFLGDDDDDKDGIWGWLTNSEMGTGFAYGAANALLGSGDRKAERGLAQQKQDQYYELQSRGLSIQEAGVAQEARRNDILERELNDKINTRKRHNTSINAGPKSKPKKIRMR